MWPPVFCLTTGSSAPCSLLVRRAPPNSSLELAAHTAEGVGSGSRSPLRAGVHTASRSGFGVVTGFLHWDRGLLPPSVRHRVSPALGPKPAQLLPPTVPGSGFEIEAHGGARRRPEGEAASFLRPAPRHTCFPQLLAAACDLRFIRGSQPPPPAPNTALVSPEPSPLCYSLCLADPTSPSDLGPLSHRLLQEALHLFLLPSNSSLCGEPSSLCLSDADAGPELHELHSRAGTRVQVLPAPTPEPGSDPSTAAGAGLPPLLLPRTPGHSQLPGPHGTG